MSLRSSSIFSSDTDFRARRASLRDALATTIWTVAALAILDVGVGRLFPPTDPRSGRSGGRLVQYFNYGWSVEAKLRRMVGPSDAESAPITLAGWTGKPDVVHLAKDTGQAEPGWPEVSFYGMSFSNYVGEELVEQEPRLRVRLLAGPAAPPSHSFALFETDRGADSEVVVLAILASSVHALQTTTGLTWQFEAPAPYTYPNYWTDGAGRLVSEPARFEDPAALREALADPGLWATYLEDLRRRDGGYSDLLVPASPLDSSTIARLLRRAVAQSKQSWLRDRIRSADMFRPDSGVAATLSALTVKFAEMARELGKRPFVLLIEDRGYDGSLERLLGPTLRAEAVPYLNTHSVCPATDPRNFVSDGHFTTECNRKIASSFLGLLRRVDALPAQGSAGGESDVDSLALPGDGA